MYELVERLLFLSFRLQIRHFLHVSVLFVCVNEVWVKAIEFLEALLLRCSCCDLSQCCGVGLLFFRDVFRSTFELTKLGNTSFHFHILRVANLEVRL